LISRILNQGVGSGSIRAIEPDSVAWLMYQLGNLLVVREAMGDPKFRFKEMLSAMDDLINYGLAAKRPERRDRK
ncbi:MAG: hypothetical protein ABGY42_14825, partial [bacterium]